MKVDNQCSFHWIGLFLTLIADTHDLATEVIADGPVVTLPGSLRRVGLVPTRSGAVRDVAAFAKRNLAAVRHRHATSRDLCLA